MFNSLNFNRKHFVGVVGHSKEKRIHYDFLQ